MSVWEVARARGTLSLGFYLALAMAVGPLVHYALSALGPVLIGELDLSATSFGALWLVSFAFAGVFTIAGGRLTDRFGVRYLLAGTFCAAGLGLLVGGSAQSYAWLLAAASLSGIAQSMSNPATNSAVTTGVPAERQGVALGIKQSGVQVSQFFAGLALPSVALVLGWRAGLLACTGLAVIGLVWTHFAVPRPTGTTPRRPRGAAARLDPVVWWATAFAFGTGMVTQVTNVYLPLYAHLELGASVTTAGLVTAVLGGVGVVARLIWGRMADRFHDVRVPLRAVAGLAAVAMVLLLLAERLASWLIWVGAAAFSISVLASNVIVMLAIVRGVRASSVGHATGWMSTGLYAGFMVGPVSMGWIVDATGAFTLGWLGVTGICLVLLALTFVWRSGAAGRASDTEGARSDG